MTSQFWKWLSRANARTALLAAVMAFIVAAAYWVWREVDREDGGPVYAGGLTAGSVSVTNRVELLAFIKAQQKNLEKAMNNPFYRKPTWKSDPQRPETLVKPNVANSQKPADPVPPKPPSAPPRETPFLFRGIMTRPDGAVTALIENQKTKKQRYFMSGEKLLDGTVEGIGPESVTLRRADGGTVVLARGKSVKIGEE